jgi:hypothetical protein
MTNLITILGAGKGTWTNVLKLAKKEEFENVFILTSSWASQKLDVKDDKIKTIIVDFEKPILKLRDEIYVSLKGKVKGFEVAVNIESGTGKEHTALLTALTKLGFALRFVSIQEEKIFDLSSYFDISLE